MPGTGTFFDTFLLDKEKKRKLSTCFFRIMGISRSESGEFSFRFWGFSIDKTHSGLSCYHVPQKSGLSICVSMPSRAWVVTSVSSSVPTTIPSFNALSGLSCYGTKHILRLTKMVSMPSRAWVVTARIYNILNFSWYFLYIPAIYKCILAYLPIFFNQLSEFLRCESPSTFLETCLSHHSFIWW